MTTPDPDRTTGENQTGSEDFESGLDYGAFVDDDDTPKTSETSGASETLETPEAPEELTTSTIETPRFLQDSDAETTPIARQTELAREEEAQPTEVIDDHAQDAEQAQDTEVVPDDDAQRTEVIGDHAAHAAQPAEEAQPTEVIGDRTEPASESETDRTAAHAEHNYTVPLPDLTSEQDAKINPDPADPFTGVAAVPASGGMGHEDTDRRTRREAEARAMARDEALESPRTLSRVLQVLLAIFAPLVLLIATIRLVASPVFLWLEYRRPGFPVDDFGFSTEDRTVYGSYGLDYLFNLSNSRYLSELTTADGSSALFTSDEVSHMHDVKIVMLITMLAGIVLGLACLVFVIILARTRKGGIRRALFAGSVWLIVAMIGLAVAAVLGWETFFAGFHSLFFADGTWTFYASDTLIRLYPNQFWIDAGITIAALTLITAIVTLVLTWPTRRRREDSRQDQIQLITRKNYWASESVR